jgi:hypothetical protein
MEFERYEDVIDAFERDNMGYDTLTDYIKGENIKIKEIDMSPLNDLKDILGSKPKEGIMTTDEAMLIAERPDKDRMLAERDPLLVEEYEKYVYDMLEQGLEPMSFEQFRSAAFAGEAKAPVETEEEEVVKEKKVISLAKGGLSKLLEV